MLAPVSEMVNQHVNTLVQYPPVQGGTTFDMAKMIQEAMQKTQQ